MCMAEWNNPESGAADCGWCHYEDCGWHPNNLLRSKDNDTKTKSTKTTKKEK